MPIFEYKAYGSGGGTTTGVIDADTDREGTDSHEDVDDWINAVAPYTKWRWTARQPERIGEWVRKAYKISTVLPGGPTHIRIPRNLMYQPNV